MNRGYVHIAVVLDRSGSMESIRDDTVGGFNAFLKAQKELPGTATLTLVQFDSQDPYEVVYHVKLVADVQPLTRDTYVPRAGTPLLDAVGRGINDIEKTIAALPEAERPGKVLVAIITDGQENASVEFTKDRVEKMVKEKIDKDGWHFRFLSAHMSAFSEAAGVGIQASHVTNFAKDSRGTGDAWTALSFTTSSLRADSGGTVGFRPPAKRPRRKPPT